MHEIKKQIKETKDRLEKIFSNVQNFDKFKDDLSEIWDLVGWLEDSIEAKYRIILTGKNYPSEKKYPSGKNYLILKDEMFDIPYHLLTKSIRIVDYLSETINEKATIEARGPVKTLINYEKAGIAIILRLDELGWPGIKARVFTPRSKSYALDARRFYDIKDLEKYLKEFLQI